MLSEQVGAQKEKIKDLETVIALKRNNLTSTEELLQDVSTVVDYEIVLMYIIRRVMSNIKLISGLTNFLACFKTSVFFLK